MSPTAGGRTEPGPGDDLSGRLGQAVGRVLGDSGATVSDLRRMSGGASRQTWSFRLHRGDGRVEALVLRRDPPGATTGLGMAREAALLSAAAEAGVAVPRVVASSDDPEILGSPFVVMERVEGETIPRRILRDGLYAGAREVMATQCGSILAGVHRIPPDAVDGLDDGDVLEHQRQFLEELAQPHPAFELALRWLESNRPDPFGRCLVHGDFRNGNLIVGPEGIRAVLDWELAHVGDPIEDLGWLCVRSWRFGSPLPVGGFGSYEDLLSAYRDASGRAVDRETLRWWEVFGTLRWGIICIVQTLTHLSGTVRSVELAAIGRRVCEVEWDLLDLLGAPR